MNRYRAMTLLVGHALAEGAPAADAMRRTGAPNAIRGAAEIDAGRLSGGLREAGLPEDLCRLAGTCPEALEPAQRRLAELPPRVAAQVQIIEVLAYVLLVGSLQLITLFFLEDRAMPELEFIGLGQGVDYLDWIDVARVILMGALPAGMLAIVAVVWKPGWLPGWGRHRLRAREASLAAALIDAGAPAEARAAVFASLQTLTGRGATAAELDVVRRAALADADAARRRLVALARAIGVGLLVVVAVAATGSVYHLVARMVQWA